MSARELRELLASIFESADETRLVLGDLQLRTEQFAWNKEPPTTRWGDILWKLVKSHPKKLEALVERAIQESPADEEALRHIDLAAVRARPIDMVLDPSVRLSELRREMIAAPGPRELRRIRDEAADPEWKDCGPAIRVEVAELLRDLERALRGSEATGMSAARNGWLGRLVIVILLVIAAALIARLLPRTPAIEHAPDASPGSAVHAVERPGRTSVHAGPGSAAPGSNADAPNPTEGSKTVVPKSLLDLPSQLRQVLIHRVQFPVGECMSAEWEKLTRLNDQWRTRARCRCSGGKLTDYAEIDPFVNESDMPATETLERTFKDLGDTCGQ